MAVAPDAPAPPTLPDYLTNPNAVLGDVEASWRYGLPPDYSKTRSYFSNTKTTNHPAGSLPELVQNLVKNWEIEASFKTKLSDWRTINPDEYSFSINGREPQTGEEMLRIGTYNAIIQPGNDYYSPKNSTFAQSHKTFKRMMPTFAWEVLDVIGAPPVVGIKWRHWGIMKEDYVGFNEAGEKVTAKAHGGPIDLKGTTWAWVDDQVRVKKLETWFDPIEMFRQIAPNGIVNKETIKPEEGLSAIVPEKRKSGEADAPHQAATPDGAISTNGNTNSPIATNPIAEQPHMNGADDTMSDLTSGDAVQLKQGDVSETGKTPDVLSHAMSPNPGNSDFHSPTQDPSSDALSGLTPEEVQLDPTNGIPSDPTLDSVFAALHDDQQMFEKTDAVGQDAAPITTTTPGYSLAGLGDAADVTHSEGHVNGTIDDPVANIAEGSAVAIPPKDARTQQTHEEMSAITPLQCPFMNRE